MSAPISKKLKFKGETVKKKKRAHREVEDDGFGELDEGDPTGWVFPANVNEIIGPCFIILPTDPPTCLAWEPTRQRVYAAPLTLPVAPSESEELTTSEVLQVVEPTDVNHVWVASRLSGAEGVISLRSSSGTFLTAAPSGVLSATTPSRGSLESFVPHMTSTSSLHPSLSLETFSSKYISVTKPDVKPSIGLGGGSSSKTNQFEIRADADAPTDGDADTEVTAGGGGTTRTGGWKVKCQREAVLKARIAGMGEDGKKRKIGPDGRRVDTDGTVGDEKERNKKFQTWGMGKSVIAEGDRREIKTAKKEGRLGEAMLDRRAKLKHDKFC